MHSIDVANAATGIVMSHGVMSNAGWLQRFARALAVRGSASIAVDRRGCGTALSAEGRNDPKAWVADLVAAMDTMSARVQRVVLLGWCWGARTAILAAKARPPEHLVLMAPGLALTDRVKQRIAEIRATSEDPTSLPFELDAFSDEQHVLDWIRSDELAWRTQPRAFLAPSAQVQTDAIVALPTLTMPITTFLAATDHIVDNAAIRKLVRGPVIEVSGGHALILETPDAIADRLVAALG